MLNVVCCKMYNVMHDGDCGVVDAISSRGNTRSAVARVLREEVRVSRFTEEEGKEGGRRMPWLPAAKKDAASRERARVSASTK